MTAVLRAAVSPSAEQGFTLSDADFQRIVRMIYARAGIHLTDGKRQMVYGRLARRLRVLGLRSFGDYLAQLEAPDAPEWEHFTNALTTNLTAFFREAHHFDELARMLSERRGQGRIDIWCAAASTGEEPYSLAITAARVFGSLLTPLRIIATDLDTQVLETARAGIYPLERIMNLDAADRQRYFLCGTGPNAGKVRVRPQLQAMIEFRPLNLLAPTWDIGGHLDAIFCRNVMIYFDKPTQRQILGRFVPLLAPGGRLFAGHSESFLHSADLFENLGRTIYRPKAAA